VKHVKKGVDDTLYTCVNVRVEILWPGRHVFSKSFEFPESNERDNLGPARVPHTTSRGPPNKWVREIRRRCATWGALVTRINRECNKRY